MVLPYTRHCRIAIRSKHRCGSHSQRYSSGPPGCPSLKVGPVIAIGRPGEELAEPGAARMYVGDDDWQVMVTDLGSVRKLVLASSKRPSIIECTDIHTHQGGSLSWLGID